MASPMTSQFPVLLVDDEPQQLRSASMLLRAAGIANVMTLNDSRDVLPLLETRDIGVLVLDLMMPHLSGETLLQHVAEMYPDLPVILMTARNDLDTAVDCMRRNASDYLVKPVEKSRLVGAIQRALELRGLRDEVLSLKDRMLNNELRHPAAFAEIITQSRVMQAIFRYVEAVAASPQPVLITGETGTGKELLARAAHQLSGAAGELIAVNVAGLDDTMFSDTLFGHEKGAFTGAEQRREGLITQAQGGTLFLDEIGDLSMASQVKLLRLLQEGAYYPLGADRPVRSHARIVAATNYDVVARVNDGLFRKDLYYRLRAHHLHMPPLRERREDIPLLTQHFLEQAAQDLGKKAPTPPVELFQLLSTYAFPGNVRELEAMVFDAVAHHPGGNLSLQRFREVIQESQPLTGGGAPEMNAPVYLNARFPDHLPTLKEAEEALIAEALQRVDGNQGLAANLLGLTRQALNKRLTRRKSAPAPRPDGADLVSSDTVQR